MRFFLGLIGLFVGALTLSAAEHADKVYTAAEAAKHVGETVVVKAHVDGIRRMDSGLILINLDGRYPNQALTAVVRPGDAEKVGDVMAYQGKNVRVHGTVIEFRGRAEIELRARTDIAPAE